VRSVGDGDVGALTAVSGVGRKTAERILVELRDKVGSERTTAVGPALSTGHQDAISALIALGFTPPKAQKSVRAAVAALPHDTDLEEIVRRALAESSNP
jgi:Holliday junction DNA helicase RuvA